MSQIGLFDWIAQKYEIEFKPRTGIIPDDGIRFNHWKIYENRPIFRISAAAALSRNTGSVFKQRTYVSYTGSNNSIGGLVYPTSFLNASYGFHPEDKNFNEDNKNLCKTLGITKINKELRAYEWDLTLNYLPRFRNKPLKYVQAWILNATFKSKIRPQFSPALPIPSKKLEWRCISSGTTCQALESLSSALASGKPPLVLITGSPGSGKEAYAAALHYGRIENWDEDETKAAAGAEECYKICSLAGKTEKELDNWLNIELNEIVNGGTVFFDECDKPDKSVRSHLLRLLEQRIYQPLDPASNEINCKNITFVLGAGKRLAEVQKEEPADFWTRMEYHIEVGDPLMAPTNEERKRVIKSFFLHFWWDTTSKWLEGVIGKPTLNWDDYFSTKPTGLEIAEAVFSNAIGIIKNGILEPSEPAYQIADRFAENLSTHLERRELSVRGLRSCVKTVTWELGSVLIGLATAHPQIKNDEFRDISRQAVARAVGTVIQVLPA